MNVVLVLAFLMALGVILASLAAAMDAGGAKSIAPPQWQPAAPGPLQPPSFRDRLNGPFEALAERTNRRRRLNGGLSLSEHLARADLKFRVSEFVMIQAAFLCAGALLALWRFGFAPQFVIFGVSAYLIPMRFVYWRQGRRLRAFNRRLPDTLSLLANALKAGLSLPQAIEAVAKNTTAPISDELSRVIRETNLGTTTPEALAHMVRRVGSEDLDLIVTAITIQSTVGGNLARILDGISHTIRQRVQMKSQISALTAQMRASGWIITLLPFIVAAILDLVTPSYFNVMFSDPGGRALLVLAAISIGIGNFFIRRITNFRI